ncbi:response regulator transcription factor [Anaerocolumna sp.]|uniref:response regulator transcription factor n=1 Tax=Anaerocolumna sp. TaxID=2041569 RepID=UPI0028AF8270|nr:response regulator [Anaerocolumna sp.]
MGYHVVLVDDEKMVLNSLALAFDWSSTNFEVIATFQSSKEALEQILLLKPDVVFTDIRMPEMDGLQLMEAILEKQPQIKFVIISGYEEFSYAKQALSLGAINYCLKPLEDDEIHAMLNQIEEILSEEEFYFNTLFHSMIYNPSSINISRFITYLKKVKNCAEQITLAASICDISHELEGYVHYYKIQCELDTYIYIIEDNTFLNSIGFRQRIKQKFLRDQIKNFCYLPTTITKDFYQDLERLFNSLYSYYHHPIDITKGDFAVTEETSKTDYIDLLSGEASKNNSRNVVSLLKNYATLYPVNDRNIHDVIKIYNITMSLLYRLDGNYFEDYIRTPIELLRDFPDIDSMFSYLIVFLNNNNYVNNNINFDLIKNDTFKKVIDYIHQNFTNQLSFQAICQTYIINPSYLSQVFKRELGTTFTNYIKDLRINYAKDLLAKTNEPISVICEKVGYTQYFYFSKLFKKEAGMTPTQYREQEQRLLKNILT